MNSPLKVGVVGMGGIGYTHCNCYKNDSLAELVAVCDIIKAKADKAAEDFGCKAYYSVKDMLKAHPELDIVDVTTSGYENGSLHYEPTMQALDAGKHVLCEKPLSNEVTEAREMVAFAHEKDLYLGCNLTHILPSLPARSPVIWTKVRSPVSRFVCHSTRSDLTGQSSATELLTRIHAG